MQDGRNEQQLCGHLDGMGVLVPFIYAYVQRAGPDYTGVDEGGDEALAIMLTDDDIDSAAAMEASWMDAVDMDMDQSPETQPAAEGDGFEKESVKSLATLKNSDNELYSLTTLIGDAEAQVCIAHGGFRIRHTDSFMSCVH